MLAIRSFFIIFISLSIYKYANGKLDAAKLCETFNADLGVLFGSVGADLIDVSLCVCPGRNTTKLCELANSPPFTFFEVCKTVEFTFFPPLVHGHVDCECQVFPKSCNLIKQANITTNSSNNVTTLTTQSPATTPSTTTKHPILSGRINATELCVAIQSDLMLSLGPGVANEIKVDKCVCPSQSQTNLCKALQASEYTFPDVCVAVETTFFHPSVHGLVSCSCIAFPKACEVVVATHNQTTNLGNNRSSGSTTHKNFTTFFFGLMISFVVFLFHN